MRRVLLILVGFIVLIAAGIFAALRGGRHEGAGEVSPGRLSPAVVQDRATRQSETLAKLAPDAGEAPAAKQVLFGDLHAHTTFSVDAFLRSLPMLQGEGAHPPADACDFARFCSQLDFWSINDHSEGISPEHWRETKETIRQCNAAAGDPKNPDSVAFLGWEWTQVGLTPENHYGHKNVIFRDTDDDKVPSRPISARNPQLVGGMLSAPLWQRIQLPLVDYEKRQRYLDFGIFQAELRKVPACDTGVNTRELPADCYETAQTPDVLYEKLSQWGFDTIVIPHGNTWGFYTPPASTWDKQLVGAAHDPDKQGLIEVYSGHGNSEEYREWRGVEADADGNPICPEPSKSYEPCCYRAGEIIRARCGNVSADECEQRVREARANYAAAGAAGRITVPATSVDDWKDCGQCRDCFNPAFNFVPGTSVQYALTISNFDDPANPRRFRFGFIGSSDNHSARPGTGFKEFRRRMMTEATGPRSETWNRRLAPKHPDETNKSLPFEVATTTLMPFQYYDTERQASFFMTGGLAAVHSTGRDRDSIWAALKRKEVYATSGERILLWFDLLNGPNGQVPMGGETKMAEPPRFRVRAAGSFKQLFGCPEYAINALPPERLEYLCRGECYNPSDERFLITRIEVVRIQPQTKQGEPLRPLIQDPWKTFDCPADAAGCAIEFDDSEFSADRETIYYVRAIQQPTRAVNAGGLRCRYDEQGKCVEVNPCYGDYRTSFDDDCLSPNEERAWSSPIYIN